jgi:hypothetical protein
MVADWRSRPRKPEAGRRSVVLTVRVTEAEADRLRTVADTRGMTVSDLLVGSALGFRGRRA